MISLDPKEMVSRAFRDGQIVEILCGRDGFRFVPPKSMSPDKTDIVYMIDLIYQDETFDLEEKRMHYTNALVEAASIYDGLNNVASAIMIETLRIKRSRSFIGFSRENIASHLRKSIAKWQKELSSDFSGMGRGIAEGRLGDLKRLNTIILDLGGPSFI